MISACMVCMLMSCHVQVNRNHLREIADLTASLHLSSVPVSNVCCVHRYSTACVMCVCVCVCARVHACVRACTHVWISGVHKHSHAGLPGSITV